LSSLPTVPRGKTVSEFCPDDYGRKTAVRFWVGARFNCNQVRSRCCKPEDLRFDSVEQSAAELADFAQYLPYDQPTHVPGA
jgi:hypothetical protein